MSNKRAEIGSEFWLERVLPQATQSRDGIYALSGRTALDIILQRILDKRAIRSAYLPAYCCDSMIQPFRDRGVEVVLYDMDYDGGLHYHIDEERVVDVFYVNNYFGYGNTINSTIIDGFKARGSIIIYDKTHSFLMDEGHPVADYSFASIRKWLGVIDGAVVNGVTDGVVKQCPFLNSKKSAMLMKSAYIDGDDSVEKNDFLMLFREFGQNLIADYRDYGMDDLSYSIYKSTNLIEIKAKRRENACYLHNNLDLCYLSSFDELACPLFVPVLFESKGKRDFLRNKLIEADVYCPIHWPKNSLVNPRMAVNKIYDTELSLICDQRYGLSQMRRQIEIIKRFI